MNAADAVVQMESAAHAHKEKTKLDVFISGSRQNSDAKSVLPTCRLHLTELSHGSQMISVSCRDKSVIRASAKCTGFPSVGEEE